MFSHPLMEEDLGNVLSGQDLEFEPVDVHDQ